MQREAAALSGAGRMVWPGAFPKLFLTLAKNRGEWGPGVAHPTAK